MNKIQFSIDREWFTENGYERKTLEKMTRNYFKELLNPPVNNKNKTIKTIFTSGSSLKSLLCRNKTKL